MPDFLPALGALTLGGSAVVLILSLVSRSTRSRYGARWRCWAWLLLCLRLAIPLPLLPQTEETVRAPIQLTVPSDPIVFQGRPAHTDPDEAASSPHDTDGSVQQPAQGQEGQTPSTSVSSPGQSQPSSGSSAAQTPAQSPGFSLSLSQVLIGVWLAGAAAVLLWALIAHVRFLLYLRRWASPVTNPATIQLFNQLGNQLHLDRRPRLMTCQGLRVPMLAGLVRPVLLLPEYVPSDSALRYSMLHELTHFRRRDIWLKTLALWTNALHWFNPFMWYMSRLVERDTELACDEAALRTLPAQEHRAYGQTILDAVARLKAPEPNL